MLHRLFLIATLLSLLPAGRAAAHGEPIDVLVNSVTGRLFVVEVFDPPELTLEPGIEISAEVPGFGVLHASNGLAPGTTLQLNVAQGLLYWDGAGLVAAADIVLVDNPALTTTYQVAAASDPQSGMTWATYPGGDEWDAHGLYSLAPLTAEAGVYGLALQIASPSYLATKPFLLPLIYDPAGQWSAAELDAGIELLRGEVEVPASADFDGDGDIDGGDFLGWQRGLGAATKTTIAADGDADLDSDVDRYDLGFWQEQFGASAQLATSHGQTIPEPSTASLALLSLAFVLLQSRDRQHAC
ncbi:hypothetical protein OAS39_04330 [Pirellulales bacterium]|nr:hypothetical protein [Pirellulales bacterium]